MERIQKVPKVLTSVDAVESDVFLNVNLERTTKPLIDYVITNIVNQQDQFEKERIEVRSYRFSGKINILTANELTPNEKIQNTDGTTTLVSGALNEDWDPLFDGNPQVTPNNWLIQILYPHKKDGEFNMVYNTGFPLYTTIESKAEQGPQIKNMSLGIQTGEEEKVGVMGVQKHNLEIDDYVYVYDNNTTTNQYTGIHRILSLGIDGDNLDKDFILDTPYNGDYNTPSNYRKVVSVTDNDINFNKPVEINKITACDSDGSTIGSFGPNDTIYSKIELQNPINFTPLSAVTTMPYIDLRGNGILNGLFEIITFISPVELVIKLTFFTVKGQSQNFTTNKPRTRVLDATPSEYYVRKYRVLSTNDYDSYKCAFSTNIYPTTIVNVFGTANDTWLYHFNKDIDVGPLLDHRNKPLTELYLGLIKRSGQNTYPWSKVVAGWEFNRESMTTLNGLETISNYTSGGIGTIEKPNKESYYIGDYSEYNRLEIKEKIISKIVHRFGKQSSPNIEGYYLEPFKKMGIMAFSNVIETSSIDEPTEGIPTYAETYPNGNIAWRDLLFIGYLEPENDDTVDYPFVNGKHYFYGNYNFFIRRQLPTVFKIDQETIKISKIQDVC
jgi:hypothetical protein